MAKLWAIIKREYLERVRTRWFVFATIFGPLFFGAMIIVPACMAKNRRRRANSRTRAFSMQRRTDSASASPTHEPRPRQPDRCQPEVVVLEPGELSRRRRARRRSR